MIPIANIGTRHTEKGMNGDNLVVSIGMEHVLELFSAMVKYGYFTLNFTAIKRKNSLLFDFPPDQQLPKYQEIPFSDTVQNMVPNMFNKKTPISAPFEEKKDS